MNVLYKLSVYLYKRCRYAGRKDDNRGLTLVELICAIAIMSLVGAAVSGFMIVGANTYRSGTTEVELQTEAQMIVNQIGDLVIDTTSTITPEGATAATAIAIERSDRRYEIEHAGTEVLYSEYRIDTSGAVVGIVAEDQLLGENVTTFQADISDFPTNGVLRLYLKLEKDERSFAAYYTIMARNGSISVTADSVSASATVVAPSEIVVEPNQKYSLNAAVVGISNNAVTWTLSGQSDPDTQILLDEYGMPYLKVGKNEINNMQLTVNTVAMDGATPLGTAYVKVNLRRVKDVTLTGTLTSGSALKSGATYRITANIDGSNLPRLLGSESDMDYMDPYKLSWSSSLVGADGNAITNTTGYFKLDVYEGYANLTLYQDFDNLDLTIYAKALHPEGTVGGVKYNKSEMPYDTDVMGEWNLSNRIQITVPGGWARGGNSSLLLGNVPDDNLTSYDGGKTTYNLVNLDWYIWSTWEADRKDFWKGPMTQGNNGGWGEMQSTDLGINVTITQGDVLNLKEYLTPDRYSYSYPYYIGVFDQGLSKLRLDITLYGDKTVQTGTAIFDVPAVAFEYRNSLPSDAEGNWSTGGRHVVYVTPADNIDTYTSYFRLLYGWNADNYDYIAYNRFVGVIADEDGYANDRGYDLTFVNSAGQTFYRQLPGLNGDPKYDFYGNMNRDVISSGSGGNCTLAVKISQNEKDLLCAGSGTVIKEIYEYNYLFNTETLKGWFNDTSLPVWDMYNRVKGCDGYLEYHFVQPNVQITNHAGNKPPVMFCPTGADAGLVNGFYYMTENARYSVNGTTADYQIKVGGVFTSQYTLNWNGSMWCD
ncbi:MAG: prepilin-type N-terminal cleavage/methylation domain-containing protein [Lachnospiraceae bacterium]|nr:prepilin-type N-terminal cleavage/methylation domain-containing protein [Lachnospiraceae bacterium]